MQGAVIHPVLNFDHRSGDATVTSADAILAQADKLGVKIGQVLETHAWRPSVGRDLYQA